MQHGVILHLDCLMMIGFIQVARCTTNDYSGKQYMEVGRVRYRKNLFSRGKISLRTSFSVFLVITMYEGRQFPAPKMLGWVTGTKNWPIAKILAHSEFPVRMDMIIEQMRTVGCYYGVETETFGNYLGHLYVTNELPDVFIARLREVNFPFSVEGENIFCS